MRRGVSARLPPIDDDEYVDKLQLLDIDKAGLMHRDELSKLRLDQLGDK